MPIPKDQFDADLADLIAKQGDLITKQKTYIDAVQAFMALPPVIDLQAEDDSVKAGAQAVTDAGTALADAQSKLPPPPVPPVP